MWLLLLFVIQSIANYVCAFVMEWSARKIVAVCMREREKESDSHSDSLLQHRHWNGEQQRFGDESDQKDNFVI